MAGALLIAAFLLTISLRAAVSDDHTALLTFLTGLTIPSRREVHGWNSLISICNWTRVSCHPAPPPHRVMQRDLSDRSLCGTISPVLANLSSLQVLDLSGNLLSCHIPPELCSLSNLRQLNLSNNSLSCEIPLLRGNEVCELDSLCFLLLWSNDLSGEIPPSLADYSRLEWIDFESNYLSNALPLHVFDKMTYQQFLCLSYNNFSAINIGPFFTYQARYIDLKFELKPCKNEFVRLRLSFKWLTYACMFCLARLILTSFTTLSPCPVHWSVSALPDAERNTVASDISSWPVCFISTGAALLHE
ncbi:hypothetical protein KSP40_PGU012153 [Platanthera guangdongensis]|uniref:Leucine-rich repeat-containing N-terminal plant-type domain-containing protein n=1 Tax=Platanthera guangdongensis TaxID=2320717 RepID=A0ABR2LWZ2_9ASPA